MHSSIIDEFECRPIVRGLPDDVGEHQERCNEDSKPDPACNQQSPLLCKKETDEKSEDKKEYIETSTLTSLRIFLEV